MNKKESDLPESIDAPALRALASANITSIQQVANLSNKELLELHGVDPKAVRILREYIEMDTRG